MKLVGTDADFSPQAKLKTISEAGACIDHDAGRINLTQKALAMYVVARDDGIGVVA